MASGGRRNIENILSGNFPDRIVYAPNYWQWFQHHKNHGSLPDEIKHCESQLDLLNYLGADIFSRNIYSVQEDYWFGGLCEEYFDDCEVVNRFETEDGFKIRQREYHFREGILSEKLNYIRNESTIVQKEFLIKDFRLQAGLFEKFVCSRKWKFDSEKFNFFSRLAGDNGIVIAGEFFSPLKMLHIAMGPVESVYFLLEEPEFAMRLMKFHEKAQLELIKKCINAGVRVIMSMDNLDTMFHPPGFVESYSASFYEKASAVCHEKNARFFIHACGNQRGNLKLIDSLKVDGLEGFAFPPLGDISIEEAMKMTSDNFVITGGISAMETRDLSERDEIFDYVRNLFSRLKPYRKRFIFSSSCNTSIDSPFKTLKYFRDAWLEYGWN
jgi:hypothetical protein